MKKIILLFLLILIHLNTIEKNTMIEPYKLRNIYKTNIKQNINIDVDKYLNIKYIWGGNNPDKGLDCSSLVQHIFEDNNISLPRTTKYQSKKGISVNFNKIKKGDLLFFSKKYDLKTIGHVAVYLGNDSILHATSSKGVRISTFHDREWRRYWKKRLIVIKRIY